MSNVKNPVNNFTDFALFTTPDFVPKDNNSNSANQVSSQMPADESLVKLQESQNYGSQIAYALKAKLAISETSANPTVMQGDNTRVAQIKEMILATPVPKKEMNQIIEMLRNDPDLPNTIAELDHQKLMPSLLKNIFYTPQRRELISVLGKAAQNEGSRRHIEPHIGKRMEAKWQVQYTLERMGLMQQAPAFDTSKYRDVIGTEKNSPFSGSGATGINSKDAVIPLILRQSVLNTLQNSGTIN